ncbi:universal stress protein [Alkalihalobacterium chitinilyticum]|uniref:Universal stress protein n=1 Tax=Alkalihalobacterium chitinilyticum TaxID=2980103 RepID=A0ABT5V8K8_9BACI|nr:universal stress protein [Alkalihalobacterium chitinilyticum]MDE5411799.1 universal stress protein [Alkalihalobacterium chitinilyticum]
MKLLIPTDSIEFSQQAYDFLSKQILQICTQLYFVHVVPNANDLESIYPNVKEKLLGQGEILIEQSMQLFQETGVFIEGKVVMGKPSIEIVNIANEEDVDVIVIGNRSHTAEGEYTFGSVSYGVVHLSTQPVLVIK